MKIATYILLVSMALLVSALWVTVKELVKKWTRTWSGFLLTMSDTYFYVEDLDVGASTLDAKLAEQAPCPQCGGNAVHDPECSAIGPQSSLAAKCREAGFVCKTTGYGCAGGDSARYGWFAMQSVMRALADYFERQEPAPEPVPLTDDCILIDGATVSMPRLVRLRRLVQALEKAAQTEYYCGGLYPNFLYVADKHDVISVRPNEGYDTIMGALEAAFGERIDA